MVLGAEVLEKTPVLGKKAAMLLLSLVPLRFFAERKRASAPIPCFLPHAGAGLSVFLYSAAIDLTLIMAFFTGGSVTMMMLISASTSR